MQCIRELVKPAGLDSSAAVEIKFKCNISKIRHKFYKQNLQKSAPVFW